MKNIFFMLDKIYKKQLVKRFYVIIVKKVKRTLMIGMPWGY